MSEGEQHDDKVKEAATHAASSVEHRRQMQRQSAKAEAAEGADEAALERDAAQHADAAVDEEEAAESTARDADSDAAI